MKLLAQGEIAGVGPNIIDLKLNDLGSRGGSEICEREHTLCRQRHNLGGGAQPAIVQILVGQLRDGLQLCADVRGAPPGIR